jgi:thiaminase/transcriptional activator TenA
MGEKFPDQFDPTTDGAFSEWLKASAKATWRRALGHRFFREVATDRIADEIFARYLRIEYRFVDCASVVLGHAVAKAPGFAERRRLAVGLYGLVMDQHDYFVGALGQFAVGLDKRAVPIQRGSWAGLHDLFMSTAETKGYEEILSCILAAEWMYLTWCTAARRTPSARDAIRDWVALHAGGAFAEHIRWLRGELDNRGPGLLPARQTDVRNLFERTLTAEIFFHDAAYERTDQIP